MRCPFCQCRSDPAFLPGGIAAAQEHFEDDFVDGDPADAAQHYLACGCPEYPGCECGQRVAGAHAERDAVLQAEQQRRVEGAAAVLAALRARFEAERAHT